MCARARACARERERASVRCGLRFICCLRNTITFLLSDRVSRHTRDRARQCALETGDGEQGHPNHPPHLQTESRSLSSPSHPPTNQTKPPTPPPPPPPPLLLLLLLHHHPPTSRSLVGSLSFSPHSDTETSCERYEVGLFYPRGGFAC